MFRKSPEQQQFEDKIEEIFLYVQGKQINDAASLECREFHTKMSEALELVRQYPAIDINASVKTSKMAHRETLLTLATTYYPSLIETLLDKGMQPLLTPTMWMSSPLKRLIDNNPKFIFYAWHLINKGDSPYVVDKEGKNIIDLMFEHNPLVVVPVFKCLEEKKVRMGDLLNACNIKTHVLAARWLEQQVLNQKMRRAYVPVIKWMGNFWKEKLFKAICQMELEEGTRLLEACIDSSNGLGSAMYWQRMPGLFGGKPCSLKSGILKQVADELVKRKPEMLEKIESKAEEMENLEFNDEVDESKVEGFYNTL